MAEHAATHAHPTSKVFVSVWVGLVALTGVEVFLAYMHLEPKLMLVLLLGLSVAKAALIMSYFMHLRYERLSLVLWLIPAMVVCMSLMSIFFPDSIRAFQLRP